MKYIQITQITLIDVERWFSLYKTILTYNKLSSNEIDQDKYIVLNSFFNLNI